ncbi:MAG: hypothetical protein HQL76_17830 [Magnetococcales bacterium]|nr:hypothetical protein [Magnetococcales bacterium]
MEHAASRQTVPPISNPALQLAFMKEMERHPELLHRFVEDPMETMKHHGIRLDQEVLSLFSNKVFLDPGFNESVDGPKATLEVMGFVSSVTHAASSAVHSASSSVSDAANSATDVASSAASSITESANQASSSLSSMAQNASSALESASFTALSTIGPQKP